MKAGPLRCLPRRTPSAEIADLRERLQEAEETLRAIRNGEVDAVVVAGKAGPQVFTLVGAEHPYRVLIESMHEGALTLTDDLLVLYANQCFARLVRCPLNGIIGHSLHEFLDADGKARLSPLLEHPSGSGAKLRLMLTSGDGASVPAQVAIRRLPRRGAGQATLGLVVTDMTEAGRTEELLRALTTRAVKAREADRDSVALALHDNITQLLCALLARSRLLSDTLAGHGGSAGRDASRLGKMLRVVATEVERISQELRPSVLEHLGLAAVLRATSTRFAQRTGVPVRLACADLPAQLARDTEMALFRILEEALKNVGRHAHAHRVTVMLTQPGSLIRLSIADDGCGFDPHPRLAGRRRARSLGLLGMRERATSIGGELSVHSARGRGTIIRVRIPFVRGRSTGGVGGSGGHDRRLSRDNIKSR